MALRKIVASFNNRLTTFISTNLFFWLVVGLSILQGVWYALSFRPTIFDEGSHLGITRFYSHQLSPFVTSQDNTLDHLGAISRNASYLYYYLMSWPQKAIGFFFDSEMFQIIFLRSINVGLFALGLFVFRQAFIKAGISRTIANLSLLFIILTPSIAPLSGSVNYDNAVFLLSALIISRAISIISSKNVSAFDLWLVLALGLFGSLIKYEFLAIFIPVLLYICFYLWKKNKRKVLNLVKRSFQQLAIITKVMMIVLLLLLAVLFIERHIVNLVRYNKINPNCSQVIGESRCLQNYTAKRNILAQRSKSVNFNPANPFNYVLQDWTPGMITTQTILPPTQHSSPLLRLFYFLAALVGGLLVIYYLSDFLRKPNFKFLIFVTIFYALILAVYNYQAYTAFGLPVAITGRYLLPVMPIYVAFVALAFTRFFKHNTTVLSFGLVCTLLIFTQGGGVTTYLISAKERAYWQNSTVINANRYIRNRLKIAIRLTNAD